MTDSQPRPNATDRRSDRSATDGPITNQTMGDVSHTHPYTGRGAINRPFERGPVVAADGGDRGAYDEDEEDGEAERITDESTTKMKDIDHTPPRDAESANRVFARGNERTARGAERPGDFERGGKEEPVESEE